MGLSFQINVSRSIGFLKMVNASFLMVHHVMLIQEHLVVIVKSITMKNIVCVS
jgi:hypothetical protein